jgi:hypothetical protein
MLENYYEVYQNNLNMRGLKAMQLAVSSDKENALKNYPEGHYYKYYIFVVLSMIDTSLDYLNDLYDDRWSKLEESRYIEFKNNPLLDNLRSNPRFQKILVKHKEIYEENLEKYGDIDL